MYSCMKRKLSPLTFVNDGTPSYNFEISNNSNPKIGLEINQSHFKEIQS